MKAAARIALTVAVLAVVQGVARGLSLGWWIVYVCVLATAGLVFYARRWRSRPVGGRPSLADRQAGASEPTVGGTGIGYRRKWTILPLVAFGTVTAGLTWITVAASTDPTVTGSTRALLTLFAAGGLFTGWWAFVMGYRLARRRPGLVIDSAGLLDASNGIAHHRILWRDVRAIRWKSNRGAYGNGRYPFLSIELKDIDAFLARQRGWRRAFFLWRWKTGANPVKVNVAMLDVTPDELDEAIRRYSGGRVRALD